MPPRFSLQTHDQATRKQQRTLKLKRARLAKYLNMNLSLKEACLLAEVSEYTLGLLRSDPVFERFIQRSMLVGKAQNIVNIKTAGDVGAWQASAWLLERQFPEEYGKKETIKHELQIKVITFQKIVMQVLQETDPNLALKVMQRLRAIDVDSEMVAQQMKMGTVTNLQGHPLLDAVSITSQEETWE